MAREVGRSGVSGDRYGESERLREQVSLLLTMIDSQYAEAQTSAIVQLSMDRRAGGGP